MLKNMMLYRLTSQASIELLNDDVELNDVLLKKPAYLPTASQWRGMGFTDPAPGLRSDDSMVWMNSNSGNLFTVSFHERQLPGSTIKEHVAARVRKIEEREQRKIYRKEVAQIRDEVEAELLPRAFIKHSHVDMLVKGNLLIVGTSSAKRAEDCLALLREVMESLNVRPLNLSTPSDELLNSIAQQDAVEGLIRGDQVKLVDMEKNAVTFKGVDLASEEPQTYMQEGFRPTELQVYLGDDVEMKLTDQLIFKSIKFADTMFDEVKADSDGDPAALLDGNLMIFSDMVHKLVGVLIDHFGEDEPKLVEDLPSNVHGALEGLLAPIRGGGKMYINDELVAEVPEQHAEENEEDDDF